MWEKINKYKIQNYKLENTEMSQIKAMELKAKILQKSWENVISLSQGIPWYEAPEVLKKAMKEHINEKKSNDYTIWPGILELREKMCKLYNPKYNCWINVDEILITAGAIQAIMSIILTIITKKSDEIIFIEPTYSSYSKIVDIAWGKKIFSNLTSDFKLDLKDIKNKITKNTKAIILVNPNNPTGNFIDLEEVKELLKIVEKNNIYLLTDEVYNFYIFDENVVDFSHLKLFPEYKKNLIVINSWSKAFWITGWRIWYLVANEFLIKEILKIHDSIISCAPSNSQYAILDSMDFLFEYTSTIKEKLLKRRNYVVEKLKKFEKYISFEIPVWSYYIFPKFKYTDDDVLECEKILEKAKLAIVPWSWFWPSGKWCFRICYWREDYEIDEGLKRLGEYFEKEIW